MVAAKASAARSRMRGSRIVSPTRAHAGAFMRMSQSWVRSKIVMWIMEQIMNGLSSAPSGTVIFAVDSLGIISWIVVVMDWPRTHPW